jgi:hypothetical protein
MKVINYCELCGKETKDLQSENGWISLEGEGIQIVITRGKDHEGDPVVARHPVNLCLFCSTECLRKYFLNLVKETSRKEKGCVK